MALVAGAIPSEYLEYSTIYKIDNNGSLPLSPFGNSIEGYIAEFDMLCTAGTYWWDAVWFTEETNPTGISFFIQRGLCVLRLNSSIQHRGPDFGTSFPLDASNFKLRIIKNSVYEVDLNGSHYSYSLGNYDIPEPQTPSLLMNAQGEIRGHIKIRNHQGSIIREYVPCKRLIDDQVGLYEIKTGGFTYDTTYPNNCVVYN